MRKKNLRYTEVDVPGDPMRAQYTVEDDGAQYVIVSLRALRSGACRQRRVEESVAIDRAALPAVVAALAAAVARLDQET